MEQGWRPPTVESRYVVSFYGRRDFYQAAIALAEVGKLAALLTDLYSPDLAAKLLGNVPGRVGRLVSSRHHPQLSSSVVRSYRSVGATLEQLGIGPTLTRAKSADWRLGLRTAEFADRTSAGALVYSYHWPGYQAGRQVRPGVKGPSLLFQVHPVPSQVRSILERERARSGVAARLDAEERMTGSDLTSYSDALQMADGFITASTFVADGLRSEGVDASRIAVVPYGGDIWEGLGKPGRPEVRQLARQPRYPLRLIWVGQVTFRKGAHILFDALRELPERAVSLTMVCRGSPDPALLRLAPESVTIIRNLSDDQLQATFLAHDVFVMPSLVEGFGLAMLEAARSGLPIVTTRNTGLADLLCDGEDGFLVAAGDVAACRDAVGSFLEVPGLLSAMSESVGNRARPWTWERFRSSLREVVARFERSGGDEAVARASL